MAMLLASLGVPLPDKRGPVKHAISARKEYGLLPTYEWRSGIKLHNKLRLDKVEDYLGVVAQFRHQISNRVLAIGDKLGADVNTVLAFEECSANCDETYDMVGKSDAQMMASYDEPNGRWSSCFQGCNLGARNNTMGNNNDVCTSMCETSSPEAFFCKTACNTYATYLAARMPSKHKRAMQAAKKLRTKRADAGDASDESSATQDWTEMAMDEELQSARDEVDKLETELTTCKRDFLKDASAKKGATKKQRLTKKDTPSWLSTWAAGMIYHNLLRVKTAADYQHTRTQYKLLIRDRIQVQADHMYAPLWHVLAFEKCSTFCDKQHYPDFNKTDVSNDEMMGSWDKDVWSSCVSGCNMGFRLNPNGTNLNACEDGCSGEGEIVTTQAKDPYFVRRAQPSHLPPQGLGRP